MVVDVIYDWDSGIFCSEGTVVEAELLKKRKSCNNALFHLIPICFKQLYIFIGKVFELELYVINKKDKASL